MIKLELTGEEAINAMLLLNRECELYTKTGAVPPRIADLRSVIAKLDALLDDHYNTVN